jgi:hypothetical protein
VWLVPEAGWNASAIPAGAIRDVKLTTQRSRAPNKSALPRYTYLTVRSKNGESARLLVQDNDAPPTTFGRTSLLEPGSKSFIVPYVLSTKTTFSRVRMTNVGSDPVQTDLYFTPAGADGFDASRVKRATLVVPPNDVITLIDPLLQLYSVQQPAEGQLEVRAAPEKVGFLIVSSAILTPARNGGTYSYDIPTYLLGEGTRIGSPLTAAGITSNSDTRATIVLAETTGTDSARVRAALYDQAGGKRSESVFDVPRYGVRTVDVASLTGGSAIDGARLDATIESGGGTVAVLLTMVDAATGGGASALAPAKPPPSSATESLARVRLGTSTPTVSAVVPVVVGGPVPGAPSTRQRTTLGFASSGAGQSTVTVIYRPNTPGAPASERSIPVSPGVVVQFDDALEQIFGVSSSQTSAGAVFVNAAAGAQVYARLLYSISGGKWSVASGLPIVPTLSDILTSAKARRPLYLDGLEQSIDPARGTRWSVVINEISGNGGSVGVRLYEAGNRSFAIAEKHLTVAAYQQLRLDTVFSELGLDTDERRKDRTNVLAVVSAESGNAVVTAVGIGTDNITGDTTHVVFSPGGGVPATGVVKLLTVTPVAPPSTPATGRHRAVKP